jgi:hypothetical protein
VIHVARLNIIRAEPLSGPFVLENPAMPVLVRQASGPITFQSEISDLRPALGGYERGGGSILGLCF